MTALLGRALAVWSIYCAVRNLRRQVVLERKARATIRRLIKDQGQTVQNMVRAMGHMGQAAKNTTRNLETLFAAMNAAEDRAFLHGDGMHTGGPVSGGSDTVPVLLAPGEQITTPERAEHFGLTAAARMRREARYSVELRGLSGSADRALRHYQAQAARAARAAGRPGRARLEDLPLPSVPPSDEDRERTAEALKAARHRSETGEPKTVNCRSAYIELGELSDEDRARIERDFSAEYTGADRALKYLPDAEDRAAQLWHSRDEG